MIGEVAVAATATAATVFLRHRLVFLFPRSSLPATVGRIDAQVTPPFVVVTPRRVAGTPYWVVVSPREALGTPRCVAVTTRW